MRIERLVDSTWGQTRRFLHASWNAIDQIVFEPECPGCRSRIDQGWLCETCDGEIRGNRMRRCDRCAMPLGPYERADEAGCAHCRTHRLGFAGAIALGPYEGPIRTICVAMKKGEAEPIARCMADLLYQRQEASLRAIHADLSVPVPLHWMSRYQRGYNQAQAVAARLAWRLGIPCRDVLRRVRWTNKLHGLRRSARLEHMKDAFAVRSRQARVIKGRTILLVDDILTTGATCGEAARVLKRAGAARVFVAVLARAEGLH